MLTFFSIKYLINADKFTVPKILINLKLIIMFSK